MSAEPMSLASGRSMADYAAGSDESDRGSRSSSRQARIRCDDADEKDRHRRNRGGTPRLTFLSSCDERFSGPAHVQARARERCQGARKVSGTFMKYYH